MTKQAYQRKKWITGGVIVLVLLVLLWCFLTFFHTTSKPSKGASLPPGTSVVAVTSRKVTDYYKAVGTTKPTVESGLASQITAKVNKVLIKPGEKVKAGQLLIVLDSRDYVARVAQADEGINAAKALFHQAKLTYGRMKTLVKPGYVTKEQYDQSEAHFLQAKAAFAQARKALQEAQVALSYCQIRAPANGRILTKFVEPGDQATPGKILLQFQMKKALRLVANVPEELITHIKLGDHLPVSIDTLSSTLKSTVTEIVPAVDPQTRSFIVKVDLPYLPNIYPGMFGRLWVPVKMQTVLVIPRAAIQHRGQLELVKIVSAHQKVESVLITTGRTFSQGKVEVLSGLNPGDRVLLPRAAHE